MSDRGANLWYTMGLGYGESLFAYPCFELIEIVASGMKGPDYTDGQMEAEWRSTLAHAATNLVTVALLNHKDAQLYLRAFGEGLFTGIEGSDSKKIAGYQVTRDHLVAFWDKMDEATVDTPHSDRRVEAVLLRSVEAFLRVRFGVTLEAWTANARNRALDGEAYHTSFLAKAVLRDADTVQLMIERTEEAIMRTCPSDPGFSKLAQPLTDCIKRGLDEESKRDSQVEAVLKSKPQRPVNPRFPWRHVGAVHGKTSGRDTIIVDFLREQGVVVKRRDVLRKWLVLECFCFDLVATRKYYPNAQAARECREGMIKAAAARYLPFFRRINVDLRGIAASMQKYANHLADAAQPLHLGIPYNIAKRFLIELDAGDAHKNPILLHTISAFVVHTIQGNDGFLAEATVLG